jgi:serine/threonine protein kinase
MPEQHPAPSDPRLFAGTGLDRLGAVPLKGTDPRRVGPYLLVAVLGGGGMGRIYLGRDAEGRPGLAAVKVIRPEYAEDPQFRRRFEREVTALARVQGEYTSVLLGTGHDERLWMATEYIPGLSLSDAVDRQGPLDAAAAWRVAADLAHAVAAISRVGVVHRDLKPSNVVLGPEGCRVIDFGIAQAAETSSITTTGQRVGTPSYMSPEQVRGEAVSAASDVFSLGSVLGYAVAGTAPFGDGTGVDVLHRVAFEPPRAEVLARVSELDAGLGDLVAACLDKDPARRPTPEQVMEYAAPRQVPAPWSEALSGAILTRVQAAAAVQQSPLEAPHADGTVVLGGRSSAESGSGGSMGQESSTPANPGAFTPYGTPGTPATPGPGPGAWPTPQTTARTAAQGTDPAAPFGAAGGPSHSTPGAGLWPTPQTAALTAPLGAVGGDGAGGWAGGPGVPGAAAPQAGFGGMAQGATAPAPLGAPGRAGGGSAPRRRGALLIGGAVLAVAAIASTAAAFAGSSGGGHATAGASVSDAPAAPAGTGSPSATPTASALASTSASATASATPSTSAARTTAASTTAAAPPVARPSTGGGATRSAAPSTAPATTAPAQPSWITDCTYYSGTQLTQYGDTGARVTEVQCILTHRGYSVGSSGVDGQFGPDTQAAVKAFQTDKHLQVDGQVGPQTWGALRATT